MHIWLGTFFLQYPDDIRMRRQVGTSNTQIDHILTLAVQPVDLPQLLREIILTDTFQSFSRMHSCFLNGSSLFINTIYFQRSSDRLHLLNDPFELLNALKLHIRMKGILPFTPRDR